MQMNRVVIAGYVSKTPEARRLPSGTPVANVRVGESVRYADGGDTRELTNWHSLSFYGKLAGVAQALKKGDNIYVDCPYLLVAPAAVDPNLLADILTSWMTVVCRRGIPRCGAELRVAKLPKGKRHFIGEFLIALRFS